jgi:hypothetical protein
MTNSLQVLMQRHPKDVHSYEGKYLQVQNVDCHSKETGIHERLRQIAVNTRLRSLRAPIGKPNGLENLRSSK